MICDKPMTTTLDEALELVQSRAQDAALVFALTHNYTGYPMVRQAREMVAAGELGAHPRRSRPSTRRTGWRPSSRTTGQKQAAWRVDPGAAGAGGSLGDIGTHAYNLAELHQRPASWRRSRADLATFVPGRRLDDNAHVLLRYANGARGMLWASQVAPGNENALRVRIYGEKAGLDWRQEHPNQLCFTPLGEPPQTAHAAAAPAPARRRPRATRIPPGHPEGYLEGFAQLYRDVAEQIGAPAKARARSARAAVPTVEDGARGMKFIEAALRSSQREAAWTAV